jgi:GNAT superfamily N-acetyltransferase
VPTAFDYEIRPAQSEDVADIFRLIQALAEYEKLANEVVASEDKLRVALFSDRPAAETLVAVHDGRAVGFALFFHNFSTFRGARGLYLEDLFVEPDHRGNGLGRRLLKELAQIAVERECERMEWSVLDWNAPAIGFYKSLGAAPLDDWSIFRLTGDALQTFAAVPLSA